MVAKSMGSSSRGMPISLSDSTDLEASSAVVGATWAVGDNSFIFSSGFSEPGGMRIPSSFHFHPAFLRISLAFSGSNPERGMSFST